MAATVIMAAGTVVGVTVGNIWRDISLGWDRGHRFQLAVPATVSTPWRGCFVCEARKRQDFRPAAPWPLLPQLSLDFHRVVMVMMVVASRGNYDSSLSAIVVMVMMVPVLGDLNVRVGLVRSSINGFQGNYSIRDRI
jgi:hypothetical protein